MEGLNELLATSESLATQIGDNGGVVKNLRRGVAELDEASKSLGGGTGTIFQTRDQMGAVRLLSQRNFDAVQWSSEVNNLNVQESYRPSERLEATDIHSYLSHNHDLIILTAIDEAKRGAEDDVREISKRWAANEWASSRRQFVESLGLRSQQWSNGALVIRASGGIGGGDLGSNSQNVSYSQSPYGSTLPLLQSAVGGSFPAASPIRSSSQILFPSAPHMSELFSNQAKVVRTLHQYAVKGRSDEIRVFSELSRGVKIPQGGGLDQDGLSRLDVIGYKNILDMLSEMVGEKGNGSPLPMKYFTTTCFSPVDVSVVALGEKRKLLTFHAIKYLQDQIWEDWSAAVDSAVSHGQLQLLPSREGESRIQRLRAYVWYLWFNGDITPTRNLALSPADPAGKEIPVFAYIYHCLRVGEFTGAIKEIESCLQAGMRNIEEEVLTCLKGFQTIFKNLKENYNNLFSQNDTDKFIKSMTKLGLLYEEEKRKNVKDLDPYRESVFNLLSLKNQNGLSESSIPNVSLEDFLWGNLWFTQWGGSISKSVISGQNRPDMHVNNESQLYDKILEYGGAQYFDFDGSNPFNYCTVLLSCHRFGDAVLHLWVSGKFLPAIHLCIGLLYYGMILPHQALINNPKHSSVNDSNYRSGNMDIGGGVDNISPISLLESFFSSSLKTNYPEVTIDYFISLELEWSQQALGMEQQLLDVNKLKCKISILTVFQNLLISFSKSQLLKIIGSPIEEKNENENMRNRSTGHLDEYLGNEKIIHLLTSSAYYLLTVKKEYENGILFFQLAGRHSEVVEELCNRISAVITTGNTFSENDKIFWKDTAIKYYNKFIKNQEGSVVHRLSKDNKLELISCFENLLNLTVFIDLYNDKKHADALDVIDGLVLFPKKAEEVQPAAQHFPTLDRFMMRVTDDILVLTAESAKALYVRYNNTGAGMRGILSGREQEREALRERVKALVMFTGLIKTRLNRPHTATIIARIEDTMV